MYKVKCPVCGSSHTMKNGKRKGVQLYVCRECRY
ncbi:MAG: zf-TFIIB domain-containing protein, partial [Bacteroidaceae bacterium]|nr:zf-TFIIB domain-containing protein [Bacteroidaceae bacterium]